MHDSSDERPHRAGYEPGDAYAERIYQAGYAQGEADAHDIWRLILGFSLPDHIVPVPGLVADYIRELRGPEPRVDVCRDCGNPLGEGHRCEIEEWDHV